MENVQAARADRPARQTRRFLPLAAATGLAVIAAGNLVAPAPAQAQLRTSETPAFAPVPGAPPTFADLVAKVKPSVVSIQVVAGVEFSEGNHLNSDPDQCRTRQRHQEAKQK